jgi:hypothetical protein
VLSAIAVELRINLQNKSFALFNTCQVILGMAGLLGGALLGGGIWRGGGAVSMQRHFHNKRLSYKQEFFVLQKERHKAYRY